MDARNRPPLIDDDWHGPILAILGVLLVWNLVSAWISVRVESAEFVTTMQLRAMHFRTFVPSLGFALLSLGLGVGRAKRGGSIAPYGMAALAAVLVVLSTFGIRTIG